RAAILERRLAPGLKLPSSRLMAAELGCARGTILLAMDQLVAEGYVVAQAASGLSVAANLPDEMLVSPSTTSKVAPPPSVEETFEDSPIAFPTGQPDRAAFPFALWAKQLDRRGRFRRRVSLRRPAAGAAARARPHRPRGLSRQ